MLFNNLNSSLFNESEKERNLYFKVFAGCIFNELIPDNKLPERFIDKLIEKYIKTCRELFDEVIVEEDKQVINNLKELIQDFNNGELNATFDFHLYRVVETRCRGELADILISGKKSFVAIEAKYKSDYSYKKDLETNGERIIEACNEKKCNGIQVLLITKNKFEQSKRHENSRGSNYKELKRYIKDTTNSVIVLFWEDIIDVISMDNESKEKNNFNKVIEFMKFQLGDVNRG